MNMPLRTEREKIEVNPFLFRLAKEIMRAEVGQYFDVVNDVTVCRYLEFRDSQATKIKIINGPVEKIELKQFNPNILNRLQYPEGYSGFARHLWNKMDTLEFSKNMLDRLVSGIKDFGNFPDWEMFCIKFSDSDGKKWADYLVGKHYEDFTVQEKRQLDFAIDGYFHFLYNSLKLTGHFKGINYKNEIYRNQFVCLRETIENEVIFFKDINYALSVERLSYEMRRLLFSHFKSTFFCLENEFGNIAGAIIILPFNTDSDKIFNLLLPIEDLINLVDLSAPNTFYIKELLFDSENYKKLLISQLPRIMKSYNPGIDDASLRLGNINVFITADIDTGHYLVNLGFTVYSECNNGDLIFKGDLMELLTYHYLKRFDLD